MREKVHLAQYDIDAANFQPQTKRVKRPDTSERLKEAHAALSHNDWWQQKVLASRAGLADSSNSIIEPDEWERIRSEKKRLHDTL
jgi:hypothetical protein